MAYNTKYRVTFKDHYGVTIQADIKQDGWSFGSVTDINGAGGALSLQWPGERNDIFNPVRGGLATLSFYATQQDQFNEFFNANTKEYKLVISKGGSVYWSGWLTLEDYQEALTYPPYMVTVKAYDLGYLQSVTWDGSNHTDDTILDVIYRILDSTSLDIGVKERVNIYEDSIASTASDSMLDLINIHQSNFMNDSWSGVTMYEALSRLLKPFGAFIVQENNTWNICRISDLRVSHNQRTFAYPQLPTSSGSEDLRSDLSNYDQMNRSALLMACPNYRNINFTQDFGIKNLVNNSAAVSGTALDYWNVSAGTLIYVRGTTSPFPTVHYNSGYYLRYSASSGDVATHERTYEVASGTRFDVSYLYEIRGNAASGTATSVKITVKLDDGVTPYYLNIATGAWSTTSTVDTISFSATANSVGTQTSFTTNSTPISGTLTISLTSANWSGFTGYTFYQLSIIPSFVNSSWNIESKDLSQTIDADSLEDYEDTFYFGDPKESDSRDIAHGAFTIAADGSATDAWGDTGIPILELTRINYWNQYDMAARRLQCTLKGSLDYLTILRDSAERCYVASSITRYFKTSELQGEWIEIRTNRILEDIVSCWELDETSGTNVVDEVGANDGTLTSATVNQPGKVGTSYDFDGLNDYISIPYSDYLFDPYTESYTINIWVKSADPTPDPTNSSYIIANWSGSSGDEYPFLIIADPTLSDQVRTILYNGSVSFSASVSGADVWDDEWHLLSMVVDHSENELRAYLDGVLQDTTDISTIGSSFTYSGTYYFHVGTNASASPSRWYDGLIDQITINNRALDVTDLLSLANGISYEEFGI